MCSGRVCIFNGNQRETLTHNSKTDMRRIFILGGKVAHVTRHVSKWQVYSSSQSCHTATGTHTPYGIIQCYLPPGRGDIPALVCQLFKVKRSQVKVTSSRDVSADKNAITRQCMVVSTSKVVGIIYVLVDACGILSRSVGKTNRN